MKTLRVLIPRIIVLLLVIFSYLSLQSVFGQEHEADEHETTEMVQHDEPEAIQHEHAEGLWV